MVKVKWIGSTPVNVPFQRGKLDFLPDKWTEIPAELADKLNGRKGFEFESKPKKQKGDE